MTTVVLAWLAVQPATPRLPLDPATAAILGPVRADAAGRLLFLDALNARLSAGVTPESNFVAGLWEVVGPRGLPPEALRAEYFRRLGVPVSRSQGGEFLSAADYLVSQGFEVDADEFDRRKSDAGGAAWVAKGDPELAGWIDANRAALDRLVRASERPHYYEPQVAAAAPGRPGLVIGALVSAMPHARELTQVLTARALLRAGAGVADGACADLLACHRVARLLGQRGTTIEWLMAIAIDTRAFRADAAMLEHGTLTADQLRAFRDRIAALPPLQPLAGQVDGYNRVVYLDWVQSLFDTGLDEREHRSLPKPFAPVTYTPETLRSLDWTPLVEKGRRPREAGEYLPYSVGENGRDDLRVRVRR